MFCFFFLKCHRAEKNFESHLPSGSVHFRFQLPSLKYFLSNGQTMFVAYQLARIMRLEFSESKIYLTWAIGPGLFSSLYQLKNFNSQVLQDVSVIRPGCQLHDLFLFYFLPANFLITHYIHFDLLLSLVLLSGWHKLPKI